MAGLRQWWQRLGKPGGEPGPDGRGIEPGRSDGVRISECSDRQLVTLRGTIESLTIQPRETMNWLEARLGDGSATVTLIWMGRHEIPGIEEGRELSVQGRISNRDGERRIYNPYYTLH